MIKFHTRPRKVLSPYDGSRAPFLFWRGGRFLYELRSDEDNRLLIWKRRNHRQATSHRSDRALYGREPGVFPLLQARDLHLADSKRLGHLRLADLPPFPYLAQGHAPLHLFQQLGSPRRNLSLTLLWQGSNHILYCNHSTHRRHSISEI